MSLLLGVEHFISNDIKISVEPYLKQYYNYPVSVYNSNFIFINSGIDIYPNFLDRAVSGGKGYFLGADFSFEKKNSSYGFYYGHLITHIANQHFLESKVTYNMQNLSLKISSWQYSGISSSFELSLSTRFKYADGRYYTPYDMAESRLLDQAIFDMNNYNNEKMPYYAEA